MFSPLEPFKPRTIKKRAQGGTQEYRKTRETLSHKLLYGNKLIALIIGRNRQLLVLHKYSWAVFALQWSGGEAHKRGPPVVEGTLQWPRAGISILAAYNLAQNFPASATSTALKNEIGHEDPLLLHVAGCKMGTYFSAVLATYLQTQGRQQGWTVNLRSGSSMGLMDGPAALLALHVVKEMMSLAPPGQVLCGESATLFAAGEYCSHAGAKKWKKIYP
jgi:hypothetical protein